MLKLLNLEQGLGEFLVRNLSEINGPIKNRKILKSIRSKPTLDQDIIKKLSEPIVKDDSPVVISEEDSPKVSKKVFGIISKELIDNLES